jgi:DNA primase
VLAAQGPEPLRSAVDRSVPFVVFRVERVLADADVGTAEGRDRALEALRPIVRPMPASVLREELVRRIAGHLELGPELAATLVGETVRGGGRLSSAGPRHRSGGAPPMPSSLDVERKLLALCLRAPATAARLLAERKLDDLFLVDAHVRVAALIRDHPGDPLGAADAGDGELMDALRALVTTGDEEPPDETALEHALVVLELAALRRAEAAARAASSFEVTELAKRRQDLLARLRELEPS